MPNVDELAEPVVRDVIAAVNDGDRDRFFAALTPQATLSDDGAEQDLTRWAQREIFSSHGHFDTVVSQSDDGCSLIADYRNDLYGSMRTAWTFHVTGGKVSRIEAGQA